MKARPPRKLVLSIGMIVKNEEANLENCLEALQPLRDAVPNELIIVDTGSEDRTVEIAQRYTDQVYHFDWIDDFAAARNYGLDRARGEWFLFLDADEWCESVDDMIAFFSKSQKVDYATLCIRSYCANMVDYQDFQPMRIFRRIPERRFSGKIHEVVVQDGHAAMLKDIVRHMGYSDPVIKARKAKKRNIPMLEKVVEEGSPRPRDYYQLAKEYALTKNKDKSLSTFETGIELEKSHPNRCIRFALYHDYVNSLLLFGERKKAIEIGEKYLAEKDMICSGDVDVHYALVQLYFLDRNYEKTLEHAEQFYALERGIADGSVDKTDQAATTILYLTEDFRRNVREMESLTYMLMERFDDFLQTSKDFNILESKNNRNFLLGAVVSAGYKTGNYGRVTALYQEIIEHPEREKLEELFQNALDSACRANAEHLPDFSEAFTEVASGDPYAQLLRLRAADSRETPDLVLLSQMLETAPRKQRYGELLLYALKWDADMEPFISGVEADDVPYFTGYLRDHWEDFGSAVCGYYLNRPPADSAVGRFWEACLCEQAVILDRIDDEQHKNAIFERLCRSMGEHVRALYRPELLEGDNGLLLPRAHRFGYLAEQAFSVMDQGNVTDGIRLLTKAGETYPVMLAPIRRMTEELRKSLEMEAMRIQAVQEERELLLAQVKGEIRSLLDRGDLANAEQALCEYAKVNPGDDEIISLRLQLRLAGYAS